MINDLITYFKDKTILILGFGREGQSTYKLIRKYLPNQPLTIADLKEDSMKNFESLQNDKNCICISGENYLDGLEKYDIIMKAPGVSFAKIDTSKIINKIKSQLELLLEFFDMRTIGITGTKGKSTTSSLIYKMLQDQNIKAMLLGNIGVPVFDFIDMLDEDTILVLEMSSHQLEFMKMSPNISILLNVYEEHLDHYNSFYDYAMAKCNIYKYQNQNDYFLYNVDDVTLSKLVENPKANTYRVSLKSKKESNVNIIKENVYINGNLIYNINEERFLVGDYNLNNIMFVLTVSEILGLDIEKTKKSIAEFKTLPHRLEFVAEVDGVKYYDNCIGTIPVATIEAVKALKNVDTLIIGGMDRGIDYSEFIEFLNMCDISNIVCMPKTGHDIAKKLTSNKQIIVETLEEAVEVSKKVTKKGKICLISPAAASYGFFKNFEEKGNKFKELVIKNK